MPPNVQVSGIFPLFYDLMMGPGFAHGFLLGSNVFRQGAVACFKLGAYSLDAFLDYGELSFGRAEFFAGALAGFGAAESRPNELSVFVRQTCSAGTQVCRLCFAVRRWWHRCVEGADLL